MTDIREDWMTTVIGVALNPDKFAGNQCVDTVDHFGEFIFGVPWQTCVGGVVGANGLLDRAPDDYWQRIDYYHGFIPQRYDVLVYGGDNLNQWGHTAVTESADWTGINVIQQDGFAYPWQFVDGNYYSAKPAHRARLAYSQAGTGALLGVLRARPEKLVRGSESINPSGSTNTPQEDTLSQAEVNQIKEHIDTRIDNIALPGIATVRNAGPLYGMATKVDRVDAALLPGVEGQRHAGVVYAALDALKGSEATVDPVELARAVAAALPTNIAKQFVDELATALGKE